MKNNKGMSTWASIAIIIGILAVAGVSIYGVSSYNSSKLSLLADGDYDGEFDNVVVPEDTIGTDLVASVAYNEAADDTFNTTFTSDVDLNGTDGDTSYFAFQFEIDGGAVESLSIDGVLNSACATTEAVIKTAYIMEDAEGLLVDDSDEALYTAEVSTDLDEFEFDLDGVEDGKYVLVVKMRSLATVTLAGSDGLVDIEFDATTDGDIDEGNVYLVNHA